MFIPGSHPFLALTISVVLKFRGILENSIAQSIVYRPKGTLLGWPGFYRPCQFLIVFPLAHTPDTSAPRSSLPWLQQPALIPSSLFAIGLLILLSPSRYTVPAFLFGMLFSPLSPDPVPRIPQSTPALPVLSSALSLALCTPLYYNTCCGVL